MFYRTLCFLSVLCFALVSAPAHCADSNEAPTIEKQADELLRRTSDFLADLKQFRIDADTTTDHLLFSGQKVQHGAMVDVSVRRPDRLRANIKGDLRNLQFFFDGKKITLMDLDLKLYAETKVPPTIDAALDHAGQKFALVAPLADFLYTSPYDVLTENVLSGFYVGPSMVNGVKTHHLAFTQDDIDWQIWVEDGRTPVPRKFIITHKWTTGAPQYTAILSWDVSSRLQDGLFRFVPPSSARRIDFLPVDQAPLVAK